MTKADTMWTVTLPDGKEVTPLISDKRREQIETKLLQIIQGGGNITFVKNLSYYMESMLRVLEVSNGLEPGKELIEPIWKRKE